MVVSRLKLFYYCCLFVLFCFSSIYGYCSLEWTFVFSEICFVRFVYFILLAYICFLSEGGRCRVYICVYMHTQMALHLKAYNIIIIIIYFL